MVGAGGSGLRWDSGSSCRVGGNRVCAGAVAAFVLAMAMMSCEVLYAVAWHVGRVNPCVVSTQLYA